MSWPAWVKVASATLAATLVGLVVWKGRRVKPVTIAHIGNSFQFVNDLPRVHEQLAYPKVAFQDVVLHGGLDFTTILKRGSGLVYKFNSTNGYNETTGLYDLGCCSVPQLLLGEDYNLYNNQGLNEDGDFYYYDDGKNPCFPNPYRDYEPYLEYTIAEKTKSQWDYVVMGDQSMYPGRPKKQAKSINTLINTYAPMLLECGATPVFIQTYGYMRPDLNMSARGFPNVPIFTAKLYRGYEKYQQVLQDELPPEQQPRIAPAGVAFLVVWEENPNLWDELFALDYYHPSPLGTYLMACVLHTTIFGTLPDAPRPLSPEIPVSNVTTATSVYFSRSRLMQLHNYPYRLPTYEEALYLRWIAKRVVLQGYQPPSLIQALEEVDEEWAEYYSDYQ